MFLLCYREHIEALSCMALRPTHPGLSQKSSLGDSSSDYDYWDQRLRPSSTVFPHPHAVILQSPFPLSSLSLSFCVRALWHFINALPAICNHNRSHTAGSRNYMIHVWVSMLTPVPRMTNFHTRTLNDDNWPLKVQVIPGDQGKTFKDSPAGTTVWLKDHEKLTTLRRFIFSKKLSRTSWILKSLLAEETEAGAAPGSPGKFYLVQSYTLEFVTGWHWWGPRHCCFYFVRKVMVPSGFPHVANWLWLGVSSLSLTHVIKTWEESWRLIISSWKRKHIPRVIGLWPKYSVNNSSWNNSSNLK